MFHAPSKTQGVRLLLRSCFKNLRRRCLRRLPQQPQHRLAPSRDAPNVRSNLNPPTASTDDALLLRLRAGDTSAWREAFARLWPRAHRVATAVLHDSHLGEDAAADALRTIAADPGRVRSWPELEAFVLVTTRRRAISLQREAHAAKRGSGNIIALDDAAEPVTSADETSLAALDLAHLLPRLDPLRRQIVEAHFLRGENSDEIGRALNLNPATVRSHLMRALQSLRRDLPETKRETGS